MIEVMEWVLELNFYCFISIFFRVVLVLLLRKFFFCFIFIEKESMFVLVLIFINYLLFGGWIFYFFLNVLFRIYFLEDC